MDDVSKLGPLWVSQLRKEVASRRNRAAESLLTINPEGDFAKQHRMLIDSANTMLAAPDLLAALPTVPHPGGKLLKVVAHYEDGSTQTIHGDVIVDALAAPANTRYFNPESLKAAGQRFLLSQDGGGAAWVHPLELSNPRYEGWTDCTDMSDELFQRLIAERQHNTRLAAIALPGA